MQRFKLGNPVETSVELKCNHCDFIFKVIAYTIPSRKGLYCPECGEYIPYGWDGVDYFGKEIKSNVSD